MAGVEEIGSADSLVDSPEGKAASKALATIAVPLFTGMPWLVCGFSTRTGGVSTAYRSDGAGGELNLGLTAEDPPETVAANREQLLRDVAGPQGRFAGLVTVRQTHSTAIHRVRGEHMLGLATRAALEGDGLMTDEPGVLLGILTADCVPVVVVDPLLRAVAAFHAGWRGTVEQIVEQGVARMGQEFGSEPASLVAAIGPAIGACCYRVGAEVVERFRCRFPYAEELFREAAGGEGAQLALVEANRRQLLEAGLPEGSIWASGACTRCERDWFFSYRGEQGRTGRMMAVVGLAQASKSDSGGGAEAL